ncbi:MAG: MFS transporter [Actinomycetia bacterium]|nr:MFS transporter [Actinomycetes bacterium]
MPEPTTTRRRPSRTVLIVTCLALATVVAPIASMNVAIPSIAAGTHATATQLSWIVDSYALVFAALLLVAGAVGDRYGRRRALLVGLSIFAVGSLAATAMANPTWLIAMQSVLGVGAALVMPATLSTITATFPADQRTRAVGTWAGVVGASAILGVLASGLVLEVWSWRSVFGVNVALAAIALVTTVLVIPESADRDAPAIDYLGGLITVAGLGVLVYSIIEAPTAGWASARTLVGLVLGLAILAGFVRWELRRSNPLLDPRLFAHRSFSAGTLTITIQFLAFFGFIFLIVQYLQLVRGDSPLLAGASLLPFPLLLMPGARIIAPRMSAKAGQQATCTIGLALIAVAMAVFSFLGPATSYWLMLAGLLVLGAGMGLAMTPATSAITDALPASKQGVGSAVNDLARELGSALGIAILGSVMQSTYRARLNPPGLPRAMIEQARASFGAAAHMDPIAGAAKQAFCEGAQSALITAAAIAAVGAVIVAGLLRHEHRRAPLARG